MNRLSLFVAALGLVMFTGQVFGAGPVLGPAQAIAQARDAAPAGVTGVFEMPVASIELYSASPRLHSQVDHENGRTLSVHVSEAAHRQLVARLGADYTKTLKDKRIRVTGTARRFHVASFAAGGSNEGFEKTIIDLADATRLEVL